eukprot:GHVQ01008789.1.p1 GENE.GHVQ01008789.1~~GHVQ01008789.1.p1  ORF type:complete len:515 (+),score=71.85 GHVQ01008789.1:86-1630(+)
MTSRVLVVICVMLSPYTIIYFYLLSVHLWQFMGVVHAESSAVWLRHSPLTYDQAASPRGAVTAYRTSFVPSRLPLVQPPPPPLPQKHSNGRRSRALRHQPARPLLSQPLSDFVDDGSNLKSLLHGRVAASSSAQRGEGVGVPWIVSAVVGRSSLVKLQSAHVDGVYVHQQILNDSNLITTTTTAAPPALNIERVEGPVTQAGRNYLEVDPYYDIHNHIKINSIKHKSPLEAHVRRVIPLYQPTDKDAPSICHVELDHHNKMRYWEGQSIGVLPGGTNPKTGKPNSVRLYSICSTRYGDEGDGTTVSLCVRRAVYTNPDTGKEEEDRKGLCSNVLCKAKSGLPVNIVGPCGKIMLLPEDNPNADVIMVATGTGIAPYRAFWRRLFVEDTPAGRAFKGLAWLFLGVADDRSLLYKNEWTQLENTYGRERFRTSLALSREMTKPNGSKFYIQDAIEENANEVFDRMENGAHIYFCGLRHMMPGILLSLQCTAEARGQVWEDVLKKWKERQQWHVEVY